ncbi:Uncharacterized protein dnm_087720 [Desulfonema magnum]|uniref:Uncharacterized protein n=1 Tax=Desulfonema magnum TaxID=45655 RepID=A0A975GT39_9BACT|nr:Uncharacterized protein dnm_087720 [Desulfonema magnum]
MKKFILVLDGSVISNDDKNTLFCIKKIISSETARTKTKLSRKTARTFLGVFISWGAFETASRQCARNFFNLF